MTRCLSVLILVFLSCSQRSGKTNITKHQDGLILKGYAVDSIFDDTVFYYNNENQLVKQEKLSKGEKDGISVEYYPNGTPISVSYYSDGLKNGYTSYYNSSGKPRYQDFHYYGLVVGPILYFDSLGAPKRYFFASLENQTLIHIDYKSWSGITSILTKCINFTSNIQLWDTVQKVNLLLYLPQPPKLAFEYSIVKKKDLVENKFDHVLAVKHDKPFKILTLPALSKDESYFVQLDVYDSIFKKETVVIKKVE